MLEVKKAIITAAGLGTRFLPQTKAMPKEMLPIIDKPVIQIIVEKLVESGVEDIIIVTGDSKRAIEDHFDRSEALEMSLRMAGKDSYADQIEEIAGLANFVYIRQKGTPKGNARPILNAKHLLSPDEPFFVIFADDFFRSEVPYPKQLLEVYKKTQRSVISLVEVNPEDTNRYGIVTTKEKTDDSTYQIDTIVEKPENNPPSLMASVGSYLLTPDILPHLEKMSAGHGGEIVLSDAIKELAKETEVYGRVIDGVWHDTGNKEKYIEAVIDHTLADPRYGNHFREYLKRRLAQED